AASVRVGLTLWRGARRWGDRRTVAGVPGRPAEARRPLGNEPFAETAEQLAHRGAVRTHDESPTNAATAAAAMASAASPARFHIFGRSRVVTTGSGGRPYTSGWSRSRKNAPSPPTPSVGSRPYSRAVSTPRSLSSRSRRSARSRSSSSGPNWIEAVGRSEEHTSELQ